MRLRKKLSIDTLPVDTFIKVIESGNTEHLPVKRNHAKVWQSLYAEYIDAFGISEAYSEYLELQSDAIDLYYKALCEGRRFFITMARIKQKQAEDKVKGKHSSFTLLLSSVSKFMGFRINPKETTVKEFYGYVKLLEASTKKSDG